MNKEELIQFLKDNLILDIRETTYGFNGECINFKLMLCGDVISEDSITTKHDTD